MDRNRQRRFKATGKWFQTKKQTVFWHNYIFVILIVISLVFYLFVEYKRDYEKNTLYIRRDIQEQEN